MAVYKGEGHFTFLSLAEMVLCMVFVRSAAMAFNRYADSDVDALNPRTENREIPSGVINRTQALGIVVLNAFLFILTTFFINRICFLLSPVALAVVLGYSLTKRFTALSHIFLGLALSLAPVGAYLAVAGHFDVLPMLTSALVICWSGGFDIVYSLQDAQFDRAHGLHSIPSLLGNTMALVVSRILHGICIVLLIEIGYAGEFSILYCIGAVLFSGLLIYQHTLVKPNDLRHINRAFFTSNSFASMLLALFTILDMLFHRAIPMF